MAYELSSEDILEIHNAMIREYGGILGVRDKGTFEMLCEAPYMTMYGMELYPTVIDKAAKLLEGFARHQVFLDGNKRTALSSANILLELNDMSLDLTNEEVYNFTMKIANNQDISVEEISEYLKSHVEKEAVVEYVD